jgi:hypothetical protein
LTLKLKNVNIKDFFRAVKVKDSMIEEKSSGMIEEKSVDMKLSARAE